MSEGLIVNHRGEEVEASSPRIVALELDDSGQHFHKINYKKDLRVSLQKTLTFEEPGLMTKAEYFEDPAKTIRVLDVEREYDIHPITGKILKKNTVRKYYCEDGSVHPELKSPGWYEYTPGQSRDATHRRRQNISNNLEDEMIVLLTSMAGSDPTAQGAAISGGAAFLAAMAPALNVFYVSGEITEIVNFVNDPAVQAAYTFLLADLGGGLLAKDLIISRYTY